MQLARRLLIVLSILAFPVSTLAQALDTAKIAKTLGRPGQKMGDVYKVSFPRTDLHVVVHGVVIKPGLALGSWAAFSGTNDDAYVMGDLVLLQDEVNPVMEKLRAAGLEITAVHNHLLDESPRLMYMHYMGHGPAAQLATSLRSALAVSKTPLGEPAATADSSAPPAWVKVVEDKIGFKGGFNGGVLAFGEPRAEAVTMGGMTIAPPEGVAESINFQDAGPGKVATTGDFVLTAEEVNPVISALEEHHIGVMALHSHMLTEQPRLFFMHFWAVGPPASVAEGIKAALSHISTK
ncbi:MAG TPA: DUF1259 domain-containing protein [Candidatus Acidoferrales bacterium]|nr:DUF1259 domain-containing protein [Candidatus Acidoferrales bacterium]